MANNYKLVKAPENCQIANTRGALGQIAKERSGELRGGRGSDCEGFKLILLTFDCTSAFDLVSVLSRGWPY